MKFGLSDQSIELIHSILKTYPEIEKVIIYGSRAKGNFREGSDIDLTLYGKNLTYDIKSKLSGDLDDSATPYLFDISIFDKLNAPDLEEHINRVGQIFYTKKEVNTRPNELYS